MNTDEHYLKTELYALIKEDASIFEFLQQGSLDGVWYWDLEDQKNEWMSPRFWTILGFDPAGKKHLASEWQDLIYPEDLQVALSNFTKHCADPNHPYDQVVRYRHKDGSTVWVRCRGVAIRDDNGKPIRMLGAHADLTPQKRAEEALLQQTIELEKSEQRFKALTERTSDWIWEVDQNGVYTYASPKVFAMLGYHPKEVIGKKPFDFMLPDEADRVAALFAEIVESREPFEGIENTNVHKDGHPVVLETSGVPIFNDEGEILGYRGIDRDITERKLSEASLRESEEKYRNLVERANDGVVIVQGGMVKFSNTRITDMFGYQADEMYNTPFLDYVFPDDRNRVKELHERRFKEEDVPDIYEMRAFHKDGRKIDIETNSGIITYHGKPAVLAFIRDITRRRQEIERVEHLNLLKEKLLTSGSLEEKLRWVTEGVIDIFEADFCRVWIIRKGDFCELDCSHAKVIEGPHVCRYRDYCLHLIASSGRYTHVDGGHRRVPFGAYKIGRVASGDDADFITNNVVVDPRVHNQDWAREIGLVSFAGYRLLSTQGDPIGVLALFSKKPISSGEHALLKGVANASSQVIQTAITEKELRESEEKYRQLFEMESDAIFLIRKNDGQILDVNNAGVKFYGFNREELLRMKNTDLSAEPDDTKKATMEKRREIPIRYHRKKDGTVFPVEITASHLTWKDQEVHIAAIRDITSRIEAEKEKANLEEQMQHIHKMEAIGTLAGGIAHDFNNILGIILGNAELAMDDVPEWNPAKYNLEEIRTASLRAKDVVRQLLSFARKTEIKKKPTNIIPIISESLKLLRSSIPTSIEIRQNIPKNVGTILAEPTQINQVLINLCTNADHSMPEGGILEVTLKDVELDGYAVAPYPNLNPGRYVNLTVRDTGHGISQEDIDRVFDPYFTTKEVDKGTGMGLAVVHGIIKGHNGSISVESELEKGTTFSIFLPVVEKAAVVKTEADEKLPTGDERILLVDDEESIVKLGCQRLERLGYKVEATISPFEALELFRSKPDQFDLVITDMTMPKMTGDKLVKEILSIRSDMPIILCTGFSEKIDEKKAKEIGAVDYIEKPLDKQNLAFTVRKALDGKR